MQPCCFDALTGQVGLDRPGPALWQILVVLFAADTVRMARDQQQLNLRLGFHLFNHLRIQYPSASADKAGNAHAPATAIVITFSFILVYSLE
jgi:hypothetical protein